jgi:iron complex outermembrane receptor protein
MGAATSAPQDLPGVHRTGGAPGHLPPGPGAPGHRHRRALISSLSVNGNGLDNLASNADVVSGAARGNNGATAANLRGQGAASTLVLLNGRRVAAHGLNGGVVDLNSIPMAAVDRIEILKDGASAIYGTDAIGGVINFILRKNYNGLEAQAFTDITEAGGGNIARVKLVGGFGDLDKDKFNLLVALSAQREQGAARRPARLRQHLPARPRPVGGHPRHALRHGVRDQLAVQRAQPRQRQQRRPQHRPHAAGAARRPTTASTCSTCRGSRLQLDRRHGRLRRSAVGHPGREVRLRLGHRPRRRAAAAGEEHQPGGARHRCALGEHQLYGEFTGAQVEVGQDFSANQISSSTSATSPFFNLAYPEHRRLVQRGLQRAGGHLPASIEANRGLPLALRWRCMPCGPREIDTESDTSRLLLAADGPLGGGWDYRAGDFQAASETIHCWAAATSTARSSRR